MIYDMYLKIPEQKKYNLTNIQIWFMIGSPVYDCGIKQKIIGIFMVLVLKPYVSGHFGLCLIYHCVWGQVLLLVKQKKGSFYENTHDFLP